VALISPFVSKVSALIHTLSSLILTWVHNCFFERSLHWFKKERKESSHLISLLSYYFVLLLCICTTIKYLWNIIIFHIMSKDDIYETIIWFSIVVRNIIMYMRFTISFIVCLFLLFGSAFVILTIKLKEVISFNSHYIFIFSVENWCNSIPFQSSSNFRLLLFFFPIQ
jgi:hypothetical protein